MPPESWSKSNFSMLQHSYLQCYETSADTTGRVPRHVRPHKRAVPQKSIALPYDLDRAAWSWRCRVSATGSAVTFGSEFAKVRVTDRASSQSPTLPERSATLRTEPQGRCASLRDDLRSPWTHPLGRALMLRQWVRWFFLPNRATYVQQNPAEHGHLQALAVLAASTNEPLRRSPGKLPKLDTRVRFSSPAPRRQDPKWHR